jgi:ornithine decarboxylase
VSTVKSSNHVLSHYTSSNNALVAEALRNRIESINTDHCEPGDEDAFFVADLGEVYRQYIRWKLHLPRVKPFYAVKCNTDPKVLRLLSELGTGFDCASKNEIEQVLDLGVDPSRIIYAQPCKTKSYVRYAAQKGVSQIVFDNADELYKCKQFYPDAHLFLRILTDDSASLCRLSMKFGASLDSTMELLALAKALGLNVVGVSFHIGSGASDSSAFEKAVLDSRVVIEQAASLGFSLTTLDVGGGFCHDTFDHMASVLANALDEHIPSHIRVIGEPGRYFVASAFTLACNVIARRTVSDAASGQLPSYMLYVNDGIYGNFSSIMFDHQHPIPKVLKNGDRFLYERTEKIRNGYGRCSLPVPPINYSVWGPTCDGIDMIAQNCAFSQLVDVGDWLYFKEMGAYTKCSATRFNGFTDSHEVLYVCSEPGAKALLRQTEGF